MRGWAALLVLLVGCKTNPATSPDLATAEDMGEIDFSLPVFDLALRPRDLTPGPDLRVPRDMAQQTVTINAIDTGAVPAGTNVLVSGLILTGRVRSMGPNMAMRCGYVAFAQDPAGPAPSGIRLVALGDLCTPGDAGSCRCPSPAMSGTL